MRGRQDRAHGKNFPGAAGAAGRRSRSTRTCKQPPKPALAGVTQPAALVAVDAATGQLRAIVSKPDNGFDRALDGTYPPGSTFKVITSTALLAAGRTGSTAGAVPARRSPSTAGTFHNFEGEASGALDLARRVQDLVQQRVHRPRRSAAANDALEQGRGRVRVQRANGRCRSRRTAERSRSRRTAPSCAASAIGQGRILASPLQMASVAAAVASGQWHAPVLDDRARGEGRRRSRRSTRACVATLRGFMASVPQPGGTAAGAGLPAGTFGKTGTAEFGSANPPQTHAWFIGYRGDLAFAVIVEGGGVGGRVAAPLAAKFLNALAVRPTGSVAHAFGDEGRRVDLAGEHAGLEAGVGVELHARDERGTRAVEEQQAATPARRARALRPQSGFGKFAMKSLPTAFSKCGIIGVSVGPGLRQLMRIPCGASVNERTAV